MKHLTRDQKIAILCMILFVLLSALIVCFVGLPFIRMARTPDVLRAWIAKRGIWGHIAYVLMFVLQIIIAVIPGEPLEIAAGYAFGAVEGTLVCMIGCFIGSVLVFLLVRKWGVRLVNIFFKQEKLNQLKFLQNEKRLVLITFVLFLIPGTPKDLMTYAVGLTKMPLGTWMLISSVARFPSIVSSTVGGSALGSQNYTFAIIVFAVTIVLSAIGLFIYNRVSSKKE